MAINPGVQGVQPIPTLTTPPQDPSQDPQAYSGNFMSPEAVKALRAYGDYLRSGAGQQPVHHWTQGVSNMVSALLGGTMQRQAQQREIQAQNEQWGRALPRVPGTQGNPAAPPVAPPVGANPAVSQADTEAGQPALGFTQTASRSPSGAGSGGSYAGGDTKGSYFGNFKGKYNWVDKMDSGKQAGGQAVQDAPGIALPSRKTLGKLFDITTPDGRMFTAKQTDIGPARWTKRGVDVNSALAEQMGYTPDRYRGPGRNPFPTDKRFSVRPHVTGQGDQQLLTEGGDGAGGLAGRALAFNGDPSSLFAPTGDQAPQAGVQGGGDQGPQAAGGQSPMVMALSGRPAAGGNPAMIPGAAAPGPGLVPMRPQVSREDLIRGHVGGWVPDRALQQQEGMYYGQNMPVPVPGFGGTWYYPAQQGGGKPYFVPTPQQSEFSLPGGGKIPAPWHYDERGNIVPGQVVGGPAQSKTPAPQGTPVKPLDLTSDPNRPGVTPPVTAPQFAEPDQGPAGLPPEITKGYSEPKAGGTPSSMLTTQPPTKLAFQPGQEAETPAPARGGLGGMDPWRMTPEQMMGMGQQYQTNVEAGKAHAAEDAKKYSDWTQGTQHASQAAYELQNRLQLANKLVNNPKLQQVMGPGADTVKLPWNKFLSFFGDEKATERVGLSQAFEKLKSSNILADLSQKLRGLGQIRLAEIVLAAQSNIGRENTPAANLAIIDMGMKVQWQMQKLGQLEQLYDQGYRWGPDGKMLSQKTGEPPSYAGLTAVEQSFLRNNPIATEQDMDRLEHLFDMPTAKPKAAPVSDHDRVQRAIERKTKAQ